MSRKPLALWGLDKDKDGQIKMKTTLLGRW